MSTPRHRFDRALACWLGFALTIAGCGEPNVGLPFADADVDAGTSPSTASPEAPRLTPCPTGWNEASEPGEATRCEPWSGGIAPACGIGDAAFPGGVCERIGTECAPDGWSPGLPSTGVRYVDPDAIGGSGTREAPFATVADALRVARAGEVVALAPGEYRTDIAVPPGVTLWGACTTGTTILGADGDGVTVGLFGDGAAVRNLTIGGEGVAIATGMDTTTSIDDVIVADAGGAGLLPLPNATVRVRRLVLRNLHRYGSLVGGIMIGMGAALDADQVIVDGVAGPALSVLETGASATLARVHVVGSGGSAELGIAVLDGGTLMMSQSVVSSVAGDGVFASGAGTTLELADVVVRDIAVFDARYDYGHGLNIAEGAQASAVRLYASGAPHANVLVADGATLSLSDSLVEGARARVDDGELPSAGAWVFGAEDIATLRLSRVVFADNQGDGIAAQDAAVVELHDVRVVRGISDRDDERGRAMSVYRGASAVGDNVVFEDHHEISLYVSGGGSAELARIRISGTLPRPCAETTCVDFAVGIGVVSAAGARIELSDFVVEDASLSGLHVSHAGLDLHRGVVRRCPIGVAVDDDGFDTNRLSDRVTFETDQNLVHIGLAIPPPSYLVP